MLTADRFRALADELAAAPPAEREAILQLPKSAESVTLAEASEFTGCSIPTLEDYARPSRRAKMGARAIPPLRDDRTFPAGPLALWYARVPRDSEPAPPRSHSRYHDLLPEARALIAADGITNEAALKQALSDKGIIVGIRVARRLWLDVRPQPEVFPEPPLPESLRPDGLLTVTQLARWARVTKGAITRQVQRGKLTPVKWDTEGWEMREDGRGRQLTQVNYRYEVPLFDPERVAWPGPGRRVPIDRLSRDDWPEPPL